MASVNILNRTTSNIAFEATVLSMQGQHVTVRASLLAGMTTTVVLPPGVTSEMLATSATVAAEANKVSPNFTILVNPSRNVQGNLADYDILTYSQTPPADGTILLGSIQRGCLLTRVRFISPAPTGALETYVIGRIYKNGTNVFPAATLLTHPAGKAAYAETDFDVSLFNLQFADGDYVSVLADYTAGAGTLTSINVELRFSRT